MKSVRSRTWFAVVGATVLVLAVVVAARGWWTEAAAVVTAIATVVIAGFAVLQVSLEKERREAEREAARARALGPAWLLRRTLESQLGQAHAVAQVQYWRPGGEGEALDRMESQALELLREGSLAGGETKRQALNAFHGFLAYADSVLTPVLPTGRDEYGGRPHTAADYEKMRRRAEDALGHARRAIAALEAIAPRRDDEPKLPTGRPRMLELPESDRTT